MRGYFIILILAVLSGTVAFLGDIVGRQVAKKRIAIGGIRPRRVGSYFAVGTGILIALATFLLLTFTSRDVHTWVYEYDRLKEKLAGLEADMAAATQANDSLKARSEKLTSDLEDKVKEKENAEKALQTSQTQLSVVQNELAGKTAKLSELERKMGENRKSLDDISARLEKLKVEIGKLSKENEGLLKNHEELTGEVAKLESDARGLIERNRMLTKEGEMLSAGLDTLTKLRTQNILIGANQPLAYLGIERTWTGAEVRDAIVAAIGQLRQKLAAKGYDTASVPQEDMDALLSKLVPATKNKIIIISSGQNVLPDEQVRLAFNVLSNLLCFKKNYVITKFEVPADSSREKVEELFANALREMRKKADSRNLLPNIDTGNVGSLNFEEISGYISRIAKEKTDIVVEFVCTEDVYRLGNLDKLKIRYWPKT